MGIFKQQAIAKEELQLEILASKDKTIALLEENIALLKERIDIMKEVMQHLEIKYDD